MILVPNARLAADFMQKRLGLDSTEYCQGFLTTTESNRDVPMTMDSVGTCVLWDNFIGRTCTISIAIQDVRSFTKTVVREAFRYPFLVAGCELVLALVDSDNTKSMTLCEKVGFRKDTIYPKAGKDADLVIYSMAPDQCRWIRQEH